MRASKRTVLQLLRRNDYMMEEFGIYLLGRNHLATYLLSQTDPQTATETAHILKATNEGLTYLLGVEVFDDSSPLFSYLRDMLQVLDYLCDKLQKEISTIHPDDFAHQTSFMDIN